MYINYIHSYSRKLNFLILNWNLIALDTACTSEMDLYCSVFVLSSNSMDSMCLVFVSSSSNLLVSFVMDNNYFLVAFWSRIHFVEAFAKSYSLEMGNSNCFALVVVDNIRFVAAARVVNGRMMVVEDNLHFVAMMRVMDGRMIVLVNNDHFAVLSNCGHLVIMMGCFFLMVVLAFCRNIVFLEVVLA